jgi:hypothetical protein
MRALELCGRASTLPTEDRVATEPAHMPMAETIKD